MLRRSSAHIRLRVRQSCDIMNFTLINHPLVSLSSTNFREDFRFSKALSSSSFKCRCIKHEKTSDFHQGFSVLKTDNQCDIGSVWSSLGFYLFTIHVPLSFGGVSAAAKILQQPVLEPQIQASLILAIQTLELGIVLLLLKFPGKPQYDPLNFFNSGKSPHKRSWFLASAVGFVLLLSLIVTTSYVADRFLGPKDVNDPVLKEILASGWSSVIACILVYCIVTPLLEEIVYRGFLLTSLASEMKWQQAVITSSIVFSASHFSGENFLQLFVVGFVLGCSYCWSGNLSSSIFIHSLYNALILFFLAST